MHQVTILFSDRGLPKSYRHMNGYGSHTYSFFNAKGKRFWVKFHFKTLQGIECLTDDEAAAIVAEDRESHQRDLFNTIEAGDFPRWRVMVQFRIFSYADAHRYRLGVDYESLPVNGPRCPVCTYHRDGAMRGIPRKIINRQLAVFAKADPAYAGGG